MSVSRSVRFGSVRVRVLVLVERLLAGSGVGCWTTLSGWNAAGKR